ncbi:MAG: hypothetical protein RLZ85_690 [Verrucomicrobiota bacterium]|jgi:hypothetical protein
MAIVTNTVQTFAQVGIREQLSDVITNISPEETPFYSMARKGTAKNRTPEWMRDTLRNPNPANVTIEGDDVTSGSSTSQPDRLKNVVQLFSETVVVSDTARAVDTAGRQDELKYQVAKSGKALKRDMEMRLTGNYASVVGNTSTGGQLAGAEAWITTNVSRGSGGSNGGFNSGTGLVAAATDGTGRAFTEALLKTVIASVWNVGGEPSVIMVSGSKKQTASTFTGVATQFNELSNQNKNIIYGAMDIYKSDFGTHKLVPNRFVGASGSRSATNGLYPGQTALVLTPEMWEVMFLQPFSVTPLARTGHAEKRLLKAEATLKCREERGNGVVADLS